MTALTDAENAGLVAWSSCQTPSMRVQVLAAVRAAVEVTERRFERSDDHRIAVLEQALTEIRDLAYRGVGSPADALEAIHQRACRALTKE